MGRTMQRIVLIALAAILIIGLAALSGDLDAFAKKKKATKRKVNSQACRGCEPTTIVTDPEHGSQECRRVDCFRISCLYECPDGGFVTVPK